MTFSEELKKILEAVDDSGFLSARDDHTGITIAEAQSQITELFLSLLKDEPVKTFTQSFTVQDEINITTRNKLRATLRRKIMEK